MRQKRLAKLEQTIQSQQSLIEDPTKTQQLSNIRHLSPQSQTESPNNETSLRQTNETKVASNRTPAPQKPILKSIESVRIF